MPARASWSIVKAAARLAALSPQTKFAIMLGGDAVFLPLCMLIAVAFRLGSIESAIGMAPVVQVCLALLTLPALGVAGLYRTVVRYIDLRVVVASSAALAAVVFVASVLAWAFQLTLLPRSALPIFWFVAFAYVITSRFIARALLRRGLKQSGRHRLRMAIYGAGGAGAQLAQAMQISPDHAAVCFLDDRSDLQGKIVAGLPVYSPTALDDAIFRHDVEQIVVAIPSASSAQKRRLIERVEGAGLPVKILPGLFDLVDGKAGLGDIREVDVADLLGRDAVPPDPALFARNITGKVVLVTGAGGSIGSELCRQIATQGPSKLVLLDHSEFALYTIEHELRETSRTLAISACLGSSQDEGLVRALLRTQGVQTIYHAAAYKHVPMVESNMQQGLRNNVFGSLVVSRAALEAGAETCVLISTDKAVRPTNVMGASKRAAELVFQAAAMRSGARTVFSMVRFGNVLGSSGSVVPLFKRQIEQGGPVTITHPDIVRYFMLIPEAAQLVLQAGAMARGGDVFVLDMGEPVRIADLARTMIHLSGLSERTADDPDGDIAIEYVGLRAGEKLYEELLIGESVVPSGHPRIMCARERYVEPALLDKMLESLRSACDANDPGAMLRQLRNLVPEYRSAAEVNAEASAALAER
ncbi:MAG: nucleoside-diphosphate sugar epimerase/dehydratase [Caldimonas sp.]